MEINNQLCYILISVYYFIMWLPLSYTNIFSAGICSGDCHFFFAYWGCQQQAFNCKAETIKQLNDPSTLILRGAAVDAAVTGSWLSQAATLAAAALSPSGRRRLRLLPRACTVASVSVAWADIGCTNCLFHVDRAIAFVSHRAVDGCWHQCRYNFLPWSGICNVC